MIGLDTNVVVRFVAQDDPDQADIANATFDRLTEDEPGFISILTLVEIHWVLRRAYRQTPAEIAAVVRGLLDAVEMVVQEAPAVRLALRKAARGVDFADVLIHELNRAAGCSRTVTFDRKAARQEGVEQLADA